MYTQEDLDNFLNNRRVDNELSDERILELTNIQTCQKSELNYLLNLDAFCSIANRRKVSE